MIQNKLREFRQKLGFTQQELTQTAGVSIATLVLIEKYGHLPGEAVQIKIASVLGVKPEAIWPAKVSNDGNE
jgi:DNA-binding XRE family transcriptional regulator